jgi:hypothetical protein
MTKKRGFRIYVIFYRRSQEPRGLRREPSSPDRTLGSWVRTPLQVRMSVCVFCVCVVLCVGSGLAKG